ncbi:tRNA (carboxymethyluridine(34)-5-O)-methyltransferase alkbh8 [Tachypleus tridentatus]|uniref:tRNA (carboxymethyluridine(34)-5-O)-methyltransferase alkbh8 n=1 Tax=Tachypleus tridentatus TaxID=6853 RepID=UPI003FD038DD
MSDKMKMSKKERKMYRKQVRSCKILEKHEGIKSVDKASCFVLVGNGGLVCGVQREDLMTLFSEFGPIEAIVMLPGKPYSFVVFQDVRSAEAAMLASVRDVFQQEFKHSFYLSYVDKVPHHVNPYESGLLPSGLILLENFLTEEEEQVLLELDEEIEDKVNNTDVCQQSLKHRQVKHYGFEFNYRTNDVDKDHPLKEPIPTICTQHLCRIQDITGLFPKLPDQLTVNKYLPGQGIPPHIDTHSAFEDGIISLSLGSQIVMDFQNPSGEHVPVLLPRRSALIMTGESRYLWSHGITPRKTDAVPDKDHSGQLTLMHRRTRVSFTFRVVRREKCDCDYPEQCDSQQKYKSMKQMELLLTEEQAKAVEDKHVYAVYEDIADHFSDTRHKPWPKVAAFLARLPKGSVVLDIGCGNGKYLGRNQHIIEIGCDRSASLGNICSQRGVEVFLADLLHLPLRSEVADACICIAVIHHLASKNRRLLAIQELVRLLRPGGQALVYVWAMEQDKIDGPSNYLKPSREAKLNNGCDSAEISISPILCKSAILETSDCKLPIHTNRTCFKQQDMLVPWCRKLSTACDIQTTSADKTFHRFYHVFKKGEIESLIEGIQNVSIQNSYYDKGNWCIILERKH